MYCSKTITKFIRITFKTCNTVLITLNSLNVKILMMNLKDGERL